MAKVIVKGWIWARIIRYIRFKYFFAFTALLSVMSVQNAVARTEIDLINETYIWSDLKDQKIEGYDSPNYQNIRISAQDKSGSIIWADDNIDGKTRYMVLKVGKGNYSDYPYLYLVASFINKNDKTVTCKPYYPFAWGNYMSSPLISSIYASRSSDKGIDIPVQCSDGNNRHLYYSGYISTRESYFALTDTSYGGSGYGICVNKGGMQFIAKTNRSNQSTLQDDVCSQYDDVTGEGGKQIYSIGLGEVMLSACAKKVYKNDVTKLYLDCTNEGQSLSKSIITVTFKNTGTSCSLNDGVINCGQGVSYLKRDDKIIFLCNGGIGSTCPWINKKDDHLSSVFESIY